ncbi:BrnA antitoxin family protein [Geomonas sp. Red32]|uniref:BrnA antitoxin family protein n=1 Tax=Geomonas sp. Red32 TaxID=2912856 RepID=UPI00202CD0F9|nr:BrnA antitoxin family protein [Geomonas sp. Red32]MCM0082372.1 BrnA antitoxin family protein [Geomonas sp. Red32]
MPGSKKVSKSDWEQVKKDAASDSPIAYDPDTDLYDPNDAVQVAAFFSGAKVVRKPGRPKAEVTKVPVAIRLSPDVVEYFKSTGTGWQSRIDTALHEWMLGHPLKRA